MEGIKHTKEKSDMILEPMQVMTQLAILSHCPIGTKISVSNNILYLQLPTFYQGAVRWYQSDTKDDLYYLFHVMRRYYSWYPKEENEIFGYILDRAKMGINRLIETYNKTDKTSIIHTLTLYKNILDSENKELFANNNENIITIDNVFETIKDAYDVKLHFTVFNLLKLIDEEKHDEYKTQYIEGLMKVLEPMQIKLRKWIQEKIVHC